MNGRPVLDFGWALAIVGLLGVCWTAVDDTGATVEQGNRALDARLLQLMERYDAPPELDVPLPEIQVADWRGPGVASASCDQWRIRVRPGAVDSLSDGALDELLAHELAHLLACAENGHRTAHDVEWWRVYRQLVG